MTTITPEQRQAVADAGDLPVELADPQTGLAYVLMRAELYRQLQEQLEDNGDLREHRAWAKLARKARDDWARENPY
jgi:hypothetical protein